MDAMNSDLNGKSILITGASTGIGAAAARAFAKAGCRVAIHYNASVNRAEEVAADVRFAGGEAFLVGGDFTQLGSQSRNYLGRVTSGIAATQSLEITANGDQSQSKRQAWG